MLKIIIDVSLGSRALKKERMNDPNYYENILQYIFFFVFSCLCEKMRFMDFAGSASTRATLKEHCSTIGILALVPKIMSM